MTGSDGGTGAPCISAMVPDPMSAIGNVALCGGGWLDISVKLKNRASFPQIDPPNRPCSLLNLQGVLLKLFGCKLE